MGATDSLHIGDFSCKSSMLRSGAGFAGIRKFPDFPWFYLVFPHFIICLATELLRAKACSKTEIGSITQRKRADGTAVFTAQIRVTRNGKAILSEAKTFTRRALADSWKRKREYELEQVRATGSPLVKGVTLEMLIKDYIQSTEGVSEWGRSKTADINRLKKSDLAERHLLLHSMM